VAWFRAWWVVFDGEIGSPVGISVVGGLVLLGLDSSGWYWRVVAGGWWLWS